MIGAAQPGDVVRLVLVVAWAASGALVATRRRDVRLGPIMLAGAGVGAVAMFADAAEQAPISRLALGVVAAVGLHLLVSLPDGRLVGTSRRAVVGAGYVIAALVGLLAPHDSTGPRPWPFVVLWAAALSLGLRASNSRYHTADAVDRRRMQWVGWAVAVIAELILVVVALRVVIDFPPHPAVVILGSTALIPLAFAAGTHARMIARVDRLLAGTFSLAGLTALIITAYVAVVVVFGRSVSGDERTLLLLSMTAALVAAMVFLALRPRLNDAVNQLVYGEHVAPEEALRTWGSRLTRAIPLDELLLQLAESLRKSMSLSAAEIFTGSDGRYELAAGVPHRNAEPLEIGAKESQVVSRAGISGGTWLDIWIPQLAPTNSASTRVAPISHGGSLLGLIVLTRGATSGPASEEDDRVVTELARQVGLALHNVQLDSALQASMVVLQETNLELQQSRLRIVSAGDAERRRLERNLHDGAQQHLVAMAVKLRMAEELIEDDPREGVKVIEELRNNLKDAIIELRALAHGIYPPLLSSGGLREALPAAAGRNALDTSVDTEGVGRYSPEIEATVYFCCLEALQNASKHAGADAQICVVVCERSGRLTFEVSDDGLGFVLDPSAASGHGFVNMTDRLGAVRGTLVVESAPGRGTAIKGEIPLD
ncbi:MAG TPA: histidine kinase [Ilumatobacteraceae bacterium]|nr:histidine kinase [Ilumatobacteraceae bacterium]HRB01855.1 histidine kinase [Ilumatobacteraceae bacterium]